MQKIGYVYIIENDVNDEVYIGATTKSIEQRFKQHLYDSKRATCYFHRFIEDIGKDHFSIRILKEVYFDDIFDLLQEENLCIKNYGTLNIKSNHEFCRDNKDVKTRKDIIEENKIVSKIHSISNSRFYYIPSEDKILEQALQMEEVLTYENFINLFLDENTINVMNYLNSTEQIKINSLLLEWLGYEGESQKYSFIKMLLRNKIHFEYSDYPEEGKKEKKKFLTMNSDDFKQVAVLKTKHTNIRMYYIMIEKLVKYYSSYLEKKLTFHLKIHSSSDLLKPERIHVGDAGVDLKSSEEFTLKSLERKLVSSGITIEIPPTYVGYIMSRSGLAHSHGVVVLNAPGVVDSGYKGDIKINLINLGEKEVTFKVGDRIAQLIIQKVEIPKLFFKNITTDIETELKKHLLIRDSNGIGSSGI